LSSRPTPNQAWAELMESRPASWFIGTPVHHVERDQWALYAFDTTERVKIGKRSREWTAVAPTRDRRRARNGAVSARDSGRASAEVDRLPAGHPPEPGGHTIWL
jgi:hypothetical protein